MKRGNACSTELPATFRRHVLNATDGAVRTRCAVQGHRGQRTRATPARWRRRVRSPRALPRPEQSISGTAHGLTGGQTVRPRVRRKTLRWTEQHQCTTNNREKRLPSPPHGDATPKSLASLLHHQTPLPSPPTGHRAEPGPALTSRLHIISGVPHHLQGGGAWGPAKRRHRPRNMDMHDGGPPHPIPPPRPLSLHAPLWPNQSSARGGAAGQKCPATRGMCARARQARGIARRWGATKPRQTWAPEGGGGGSSGATTGPLATASDTAAWADAAGLGWER